MATPFIQTTTNRLLFDRIGLLGKAVYLATVAWGFAILLGIIIRPLPTWAWTSYPFWIAFLAVVFLPFFIFYAVP